MTLSGVTYAKAFSEGPARDSGPDWRKSHAHWQREPRRRDRERLALAHDERNDDTVSGVTIGGTVVWDNTADRHPATAAP